MTSQLLLLSNSSAPGRGYLEHVLPTLDEFLDETRTIHFVPYAQFDYDGYTKAIQTALAPLSISVVGLHTLKNPKEALQEVSTLFVGGGNSFRLLKQLQHLDIIEVVQQRVEAGMLRYIGSSAGTNMACPTLRTTNDMPIVQPASFSAFHLIPFQINPHYFDIDPRLAYLGETREDRIREFLEENDVPVLGLREGSWLRRNNQQLQLVGDVPARLFQRQQVTREIAPNTDLSWLLTVSPHFDQ